MLARDAGQIRAHGSTADTIVGVLYGWAFLGHQIGATISSWLGGWGFERFGTHWVAFGAAIAVLLGAGAVVFRLSNPPAAQLQRSVSAAKP